jgi:hypothetical protein
MWLGTYIMLEINKNGAYKFGKFFAVPYQHHVKKNVFHVFVGKNDDTISVRLVASTPSNAAFVAINNYKQHLKEEKEKKLNIQKRKNANAEKRKKGNANCGIQSEVNQLAPKNHYRRVKKIKRNFRKPEEAQIRS